MPRIRSIKPELFLDEELASLPPLDRLMFVGIWTQADREGRLEDRPTRLRAQLMPYDRGDMKEIIDRLVAGRFLVRYKVGGKSYLLVRTFLKHQRPHHTEQPSSLPGPEEEDNGATTVVEPSVGDMEKGREGKGKEEGMEKGKEMEPAAPSALVGSADLHPLAQAWNRVAEARGVPRITSLSPGRLRHAANRLKEGTPEEWEAAYHLLAQDPFLRGENAQGTVYATFDYALRPEKSGKWLDAARSKPLGPVTPTRSAVNGKLNLIEIARRIDDGTA